jgi:hypothetical protein
MNKFGPVEIDKGCPNKNCKCTGVAEANGQ